MASYKIILLVALLPIHLISFGQPFYTQLENVENFLSPSLSGLSLNQDIRVTASVRNGSLGTTNPFTTGYLAADGRIFARMTGNSAWLGWGIGGLYDISGKGQLQTTTIYTSLAYHQVINRLLMLSAGIGVGFERKHFQNFNSLAFPNQWDGSTYNRSLPNLEMYSNTPNTYADVQAGVNLTFFLSQRSLISVGASAKYLNLPQESFYGTTTANNYQINTRYGVYAQSYHDIRSTLFIKNSVYFSLQGTYSTFTLGTSAEWVFNPYATTARLIFGVHYRYPSTINPSIGVRWKAFRFSFSYDIFLEDFSTIDYFYRSGQESHLSYFLKLPNYRFEEAITVCPIHF